MLESLRIRNFRMLEDFDIPQLGRVNLIVGKNNSGKSTILEALRIFAKRGGRPLLDEILNVHDETLLPQGGATGLGVGADETSYQHFFHGRAFPNSAESSIYIGDVAESDYVRIAYTLYIEERVTGEDGVLTVKRRTPSKGEEDAAGRALVVTSSTPEHARWILLDEREYRRPRYPAEDRTYLPVGYVPTRFLPPSHLADLWDNIVLTANDELVRRALQIIDPRVEGLAFVKRDPERTGPGRPSGPERAAIVKLRGGEKPIPLNSMGDGMFRILQLLLSLFPAKGGFYLVDELENGLHFSVQEQVWRLLFQLATSLDIQIFAATHSWDCIEAFKVVAFGAQERAVLFRVGSSVLTSDRGKTIATVFDRETLAGLTQADVEVR